MEYDSWTEEPQQSSEGFLCSYPNCGRSFKSKWGYMGHQETHKTDRVRFRCELCERSYLAKNDLRKHILRSHQDTKKQFACSDCDKAFYRQADLQAHILRLHDRDRLPLACPVSDCDRRFLRPFRLRKHMQSSHGHSPASLVTSPRDRSLGGGSHVFSSPMVGLYADGGNQGGATYPPAGMGRYRALDRSGMGTISDSPPSRPPQIGSGISGLLYSTGSMQRRLGDNDSSQVMLESQLRRGQSTSDSNLIHNRIDSFGWSGNTGDDGTLLSRLPTNSAIASAASALNVSSQPAADVSALFSFQQLPLSSSLGSSAALPPLSDMAAAQARGGGHGLDSSTSLTSGLNDTAASASMTSTSSRVRNSLEISGGLQSQDQFFNHGNGQSRHVGGASSVRSGSTTGDMSGVGNVDGTSAALQQLQSLMGQWNRLQAIQREQAEEAAEAERTRVRVAQLQALEQAQAQQLRLLQQVRVVQQQAAAAVLPSNRDGGGGAMTGSLSEAYHQLAQLQHQLTAHMQELSGNISPDPSSSAAAPPQQLQKPTNGVNSGGGVGEVLADTRQPQQQQQQQQLPPLHSSLPGASPAPHDNGTPPAPPSTELSASNELGLLLRLLTAAPDVEQSQQRQQQRGAGLEAPSHQPLSQEAQQQQQQQQQSPQWLLRQLLLLQQRQQQQQQEEGPCASQRSGVSTHSPPPPPASRQQAPPQQRQQQQQWTLPSSSTSVGGGVVGGASSLLTNNSYSHDHGNMRMGGTAGGGATGGGMVGVVDGGGGRSSSNNGTTAASVGGGGGGVPSFSAASAVAAVAMEQRQDDTVISSVGNSGGSSFGMMDSAASSSKGGGDGGLWSLMSRPLDFDPSSV